MPQYKLSTGTVLTYAFDPRFVDFMLAGDNRVQVAYGIYSPGGNPRYHYGIDIDTTHSDWRVRSTVAGKVVMSMIVTNKADKTWEWGNFVCILDAQGFRHYFCHLASRAVSAGRQVKAGEVIGIMGMTGNASGDAQKEHVHYEVRRSPYSSGATASVDPTPWCGMLNKQGYAINQQEDDTMNSTFLYLNHTIRNNQLFATPDPNGKVIAEKDKVPVGDYPVMVAPVAGAAVGDTQWAKIVYGSTEAYAVYGGMVQSGARLRDAVAIANEYGSPIKAGGSVPQEDYDAMKARADAAAAEAATQKKRADEAQAILDSAKTVRILEG